MSSIQLLSRNRTILLYYCVFFFCPIKFFPQQKTKSCWIPEIPVVEEVGRLEIGNVYNLYCEPCVFKIEKESDLLILITEKTDAVRLNSDKKQTVAEVTKKSEKNILANKLKNKVAGKTNNNCNKNLIQDIQDSGVDYKIYQSDNKNIVAMKVRVTKSQIDKYNIQIRSKAQNGMIRVEELGKFYFLFEDDERPFRAANGEPERYDVAYDFKDGQALVGKLINNYSKLDTVYSLVGKTENKTSFNFVSYSNKIGKFKNLLLFRNSKRKYFLTNEKYEIKTKEFDSINYNEKQDFFYLSEPLGRGVVRLDQNGEVLKYIDPIYNTLSFLENDVFWARFTYHSIGAATKTGFQDFCHGNDKFKVFRSDDDEGFEFVSGYSEIENNHGYFDLQNGIVFCPKFHRISFRNSLGYRRVITRLPQKRGKSTEYEYTYIDNKGERVFKKYDYLDYDEDDKGFIRCEVNGKYGFIDKNEKVLIKPTFWHAQNFGLFDVAWAKTDYQHTGLIDRNGKYTDLSKSVSYKASDNANEDYMQFTKCGIALVENAHENYFTKEVTYNYAVVSAFSKNILLEKLPRKLEIVDTNTENICLVTDNYNKFYYFKDGAFLTAKEIICPYKNHYAVAKCDGGVCLLDESGKIFGECMPYDYISDIIDGQFVIAGLKGKLGLIYVSTGEKYIDDKMDKIEYNITNFVCTKDGKTVIISTTPKNKVFDYLDGDKGLYKSLSKY